MEQTERRINREPVPVQDILDGIIKDLKKKSSRNNFTGIDHTKGKPHEDYYRGRTDLSNCFQRIHE